MTELLVRKINKAKWQEVHDLDPGEMPADPVTSDLRTTDNRLSLWAVPSDDPASIEQVVIAMCTTFDSLCTVDFVCLEKNDFDNQGVQIRHSPGETHITDLQETHRDAVRLDLVRLGKFADIVKKAVDLDRVTRFTKSKVKNIILSAIHTNRLAVSELKEHVKKEIEK